MANWNCNYIYGVPPTEVYQEYGVYDETIDTSTVPLDYVGPIYNIPYIGVDSYVLNGTTYYNYNLYEISVFSYPVYDYVAESYPDVYVSEDYTSTVDVIEDVNVSEQYRLSDNDPISSDPHSSSAVSIISYSDSFSTSVSYYNSFNNSSSVSNNSYILESNVLFTETFNSSYNSFQSLNENAETNNQNISYPSTQVENFADIKNEITDLEIETESHSRTSSSNTQADVHNYNEYDVLQKGVEDTDIDYDNDCEEHLLIHEENKVCDCSIEIEDDDTQESDNDLYEESDNTSFISYESKILDWTVEVDDDDEETDDHDDSIKVNLSSSNDINPYKSTDVIKYLKEELYRYALSGHMSLKESIPVVDILPIIDEESESIVEFEALEKAIDDLEYSEGKVLSVVERDEVADITFDVSQIFTKSYDLVSKVEDAEEKTVNLPGLERMNSSSARGFHTPQQNQTSNSQHHLTRKQETFDNEDKLPINETEVLSFEKDSKLLSSGKELEISVENAKNLPQANNIINAELNITQIQQTKKINMLKPQKDSIKMMEELEAIEINSFCQNDRTLLKYGKDEEIRKELLSKKVDNKRKTNTISHVPQKTEHHDECSSKGYLEKSVKSEEKVSSKTKKKKFHNLRKWIGNMCCWMKKKTYICHLFGTAASFINSNMGPLKQPTYSIPI